MDRVAPQTQLAAEVYDRLLQAICSRHLAPGARIAQVNLAELLDVSRQPVTHALQLLKQQFLVRDAERRRLEVTPIEPDHLHASDELRAALDAVAAARPSQRVGEAARGGRRRAGRLAEAAA